MALVTLDEIRTRIRRRTDNEHTGSEFLTDEELTQLINTSYGELYGMLVQAGIHLDERTTTIAVTGAASYTMPTDLFSVVGVYRLDGTQRYQLKRHDIRLRPDSSASGDPTSYRVIGVRLELCSGMNLAGSGSVELVYLPIAGTLVDDGDTVDCVNGWEEFIVIDVSIDVLQKEQIDPGSLREERDRMLARIAAEAVAQELTESYVVPGPCRLEDRLLGGEYVDRHGVRGRRW